MRHFREVRACRGCIGSTLPLHFTNEQWSTLISSWARGPVILSPLSFGEELYLRVVLPAVAATTRSVRMRIVLADKEGINVMLMAICRKRGHI